MSRSEGPSERTSTRHHPSRPPLVNDKVRAWHSRGARNDRGQQSCVSVSLRSDAGEALGTSVGHQVPGTTADQPG